MIHARNQREAVDMLDSMSDRKFYELVNEIIQNSYASLEISPIYRMQEFNEVMREYSPMTIAKLILQGVTRFDPSDKYFVLDYQRGLQQLLSFNDADDPGYPIGSDLFDQIVDAIVVAQ